MTTLKGMIQVGGHRLAYTCMGNGSRAAVFEAAGGTPRGTWAQVMPAVAAFTQAVSYDRPGVGESGHFIQEDEPELVIATTREMVEGYRQKGQND